MLAWGILSGYVVPVPESWRSYSFGPGQGNFHRLYERRSLFARHLFEDAKVRIDRLDPVFWRHGYHPWNRLL